MSSALVTRTSRYECPNRKPEQNPTALAAMPHVVKARKPFAQCRRSADPPN
jgi:hypothetical protein